MTSKNIQEAMNEVRKSIQTLYSKPVETIPGREEIK
jgi:hypothetical protein